MEVKSAFGSALGGIQSGMQGLHRNAEEIAQAAADGDANIVEPLVESRLNERQVEASAKVLRAVDDTIGSLLDEMA